MMDVWTYRWMDGQYELMYGWTHGWMGGCMGNIKKLVF